MNGFGRLTGARSSRLVWAAATALLLLGVVGTFVLTGSAVSNARASARARAIASANTVVAGKLSAAQIQRGIPSDDYAALLVAVQGKILSDPTVERVRLWAPDGTLLFSSDRGDSVGNFRATNNDDLDRSIGGETVTDLTAQTVPGKQGLAGSDHQLSITYVPLRLTAADDVTAVTEVDHDAGAIEAAATKLLKLLQYVFGGAAIVALALFVLSLRTPRPRRATASSATGAPASDHDAERLRRMQSEVRRAEERASTAERTAAALKAQLDELGSTVAELELRATASEAEAADAGRKVKEAEERLAEAVAANRALAGGTADPTPGTSSAELEQLRSRLQQAETDRDRSAAEIQRLRAAMAEQEAALALARDDVARAALGDAGAGEQLSRLQEQVSTAQTQAREAEERAAAMERELETAAARQRELEGDLSSSAAQVGALRAELEMLRGELADRAAGSETEREEIQRALADAHQGTRDAEQRARELEERLRASEEARTRAVAEAEEARTRAVAQAEEARVRAEAVQERAGQAEALAAQLGEARAQLHAAVTQLEATRAQVEVKGGEFAAATAELAAARSEVASLRTDLATARAELEATRGELEAAHTELASVRAEAESARTELESARTELESLRTAPPAGGGGGTNPALVADLQARIAELEAQRRTDISELQRTQQALANTQYEMTETARRAKEAEERLRELQGEGPVPRPMRVEASNGGPVGAGDELTSAFDAMAPPEWVADTSAGDVEPPGGGEGGDGSASPADGDAVGEDLPERHVTPSKEGLSLRERLTRAAAARHRISATGEDEAPER